jgi:hypothetical protein
MGKRRFMTILRFYEIEWISKTILIFKWNTSLSYKTSFCGKIFVVWNLLLYEESTFFMRCSFSWKIFIFMKNCYIYEKLLYLWKIVIFMNNRHVYEKSSILWKTFIFMKNISFHRKFLLLKTTQLLWNYWNNIIFKKNFGFKNHLEFYEQSPFWGRYCLVMKNLPVLHKKALENIKPCFCEVLRV